jgi:hypothetical protein
MIYRILPDEGAANSNYGRVIDNGGQGYLYPAEYFIVLDLTQEIERVLLESGLTRQVPLAIYGERAERRLLLSALEIS